MLVELQFVAGSSPAPNFGVAQLVEQLECFAHPLLPDPKRRLGECQRNYIVHLGIIRAGSIPLIAVVQTENHPSGWGRDPRLFLYPCRQDKTKLR